MPEGSASRRFGDVRWLDVADSTNRVAATLAAEGAPDGLVVVADHQTAGRGRLGRRWDAPARSSLLVSVLLRPGPSLPTVAMALAASDACELVAGVRPLLKWPNDLVVDEAKLGGILAEAIDGAAVVGLGLNLNWGPEPPPANGVSLDGLVGRPVDRAELLDVLLANLEDRLDGDRRRLLDDYSARSATLGRDVRVELVEGVLEGEAVGITPDGQLIVDEGGRPRVVTAGDVVHLRPR